MIKSNLSSNLLYADMVHCIKRKCICNNFTHEYFQMIILC